MQVLVGGLLTFVWPLSPPGIKRLKSSLEFFKEPSQEIRDVSSAVFFEKAVLKFFLEIPRKTSTAESVLKAHNYAEYELWCCLLKFPKNIQNSYCKIICSNGCSTFHWRTPLDACFWWGNTQISHMRKTDIPIKEFFVKILLIYYNCSHWWT